MAPAHSTTTVSEFQQKAANEIARIALERNATNSDVAYSLERAGISADVTPGDHDMYTVTVKDDDNAGLPAGTRRADFKSDALAAMDAKHLAAEQERIWQFFRRQAARRSYTVAQARSALENLGYAALPEPTTSVSFQTRTVTRRDSYGDPVYESVHFTLPGEVSQQEVEAKLDEAAQPTPAAALVQAAFGTQAEGLDKPFRNLYVEVQQKWPDHSEFYQDPDAS